MSTIHEIAPGTFFGKAGIVLCRKGEVTLNINGDDYCLRQGMISIVSPIFMYADYANYSDDCEVTLLCEKVENLFPNVQKFFNVGMFIELLCHPVLRLDEEMRDRLLARIADIERIERIMASLPVNDGRLIMFQTSQTQLTISTLIELIATYIAPCDSKNQLSKERAVILNFVQSLRNSAIINRSVQYYAEKAHLSTGHFSAIIRQTLGKSPQKWIEFFVINQAKTLLGQPQTTIKEVAEQLGFPEQFTFRKYFKKHAGVSPTQYKKSR